MVLGFHVKIFRRRRVFGMVFFCHPKFVSQDLRQYPRVLCSRQSLWLSDVTFSHLVTLETWALKNARNTTQQILRSNPTSIDALLLRTQAFKLLIGFVSLLSTWALGFCYAAILIYIPPELDSCVKLFLVSRLTFSITSHTHAALTPFDSHFTDTHAGSAYFKVAWNLIPPPKGKRFTLSLHISGSSGRNSCLFFL